MVDLNFPGPQGMHFPSSVVAPVNKEESVVDKALALSKRFPIAQVLLVMFRHWRDADSVWNSYWPAGQFNATLQHSSPSLAQNEQDFDGSFGGCTLDEQVTALFRFVLCLPQKPHVIS